MKKTTVTVFAPATVANVAVGFDLLGFPIENVGDRITVSRTDHPSVVIDEILGSSEVLPKDPAKNTATAGILQMAQALKLRHGFKVKIFKGIPLGSGMGGSASSAVGAMVAANALLDSPLSKERLLQYALVGERVSSGSAHADNITPCLYGGLTLARPATTPGSPVDVVAIPVPKGLVCVLVHPQMRLDTKRAREVLKDSLLLTDHVKQSSHLAGFISGCFLGDLELIRRSFVDLLIEPQRSKLIPGFEQVKAGALREGALGCSISGSGPSLFAWVASRDVAERVADAMVKGFAGAGLKADFWISPISLRGAEIVPEVSG